MPVDKPRRPKVLLLAYGCSPMRGSEAAVGWNRAIQTARFCDTWVLSEEYENGNDVRGYLERNGPVPGLEFVFVPKSPTVLQVEKSRLLYYIAYNLWHREAFRVAQRLHEEIRFDGAHQVNFCGYREPGYLWKLDVPFVWGPIGGTQNFPWRFITQAGFKGMVSETVRSTLNLLQLRFSPRVRKAARKAAALLASNSSIQRDLARALGVKPRLMLETGLRTVDGQPRSYEAAGRPLQILWSGDLRPWKALPLLLEALARLPKEVRYILHITGRGPLKQRWQAMARRLGVEPNIEWIGWVPKWEDVLKQHFWADVFVFTSLRDTSGNVVLEALSHGTPVICLDHQGARDMVTDSCGIKVPLTSPNEVADGIRDAIVVLSESPARWEALSRGAIERARHYLWTRRGELMADVYRGVLGPNYDWSDRDRPAPGTAGDAAEEL